MTRLADLLGPEVVTEMCAVVDRAYATRIAEGVEFQIDLCRQFVPDLFLDLDISKYRREAERSLRASELEDRIRLDRWLAS